MRTFFKNSVSDWYENETIFNTAIYPNQGKFSKEYMDYLTSKYPDGKTPKIINIEVDSDTKKILNDKINSVLDLSKCSNIDITVHMNEDKIFGIINCKIQGQHVQKRF